MRKSLTFSGEAECPCWTVAMALEELEELGKLVEEQEDLNNQDASHVISPQQRR